MNANDERDQEKLISDTGLVRNSAGKLIVIDEIHGFPDCLDLIRAQQEAARRDHSLIGRFLISGSQTLDAARLASNKLGTRTAIYRLSPISLEELPGEDPPDAGDARSLMPWELDATVPIGRSNEDHSTGAAVDARRIPKSLLAQDEKASFAWRERYIEALCARGYQDISPSLAASRTREILMRVAVSQGEPFVVDKSRLDEKAFLDHLEDLGLIRQLQPWFPNELKRIKKHPKVYIRDSGLLHCLLHRRTHDELRGDGVVYGHSWEGFCIETSLKRRHTPTHSIIGRTIRTKLTFSWIFWRTAIGD